MAFMSLREAAGAVEVPMADFAAAFPPTKELNFSMVMLIVSAMCECRIVLNKGSDSSSATETTFPSGVV